MAKYVIAGKSDCPYFAKAELLADELQARLIDFKVHKIVVTPEDWDQLVKKICTERKWAYDGRSPLIWRELIDRGGKGKLVGSCSEFLEIASGYYGLKSDKMTDDLLKTAQENKETKIKDDEIARSRKERSNPLKICITSAANEVCYHFLVALCNLKVFAAENEVAVCLLDDESKQDILQGSCMELTDSAPGQLKEVFATSNREMAFKNANLIIVLDGLKCTIDMNSVNDPSFYETLKSIDFSNIKDYGETVGKVADKNVKVLVVGGPSNIICNILLAATKDTINNEYFYTLARLDENKAKCTIAQRLEVKTADIKNVIIWGQPHYQQVTDVALSRVVHYDGAIWGPHIPGFSQDTREMVHDEKWLAKQLAELTLQKELELKKLRGSGSSISVAAAVLDQLRDLFNGSKSDEANSIGIASKGWYGIPEGLVFSVPVKLNGDQVEVITTIELSEETSNSLKAVATQLKAATDEILSAYGLST